MNIKNTIIIMVLLLMACNPQEVKFPAIIPKPDNIQTMNGQFNFKDCETICYQSEEAAESAEFLKLLLGQYGLDYKIEKKDCKKDKGINLVISDEASADKNSHIISVGKKSIEIKASSVSDLKYGIQTINQLALFSKENGFIIPCVKITDKPRFQYRGMHLDVSRHYMPVDFIKKYIDNLSFLKFNYFHWHLVDDQGWRIEIKKYPDLTRIGSVRKETVIGHLSTKPNKYDGVPYGNYYTQEEIKDIIEYAAFRNITIIPEIEIPGHSQAAIASYPFLGCTGKKIEVMTRWGISPNIYNLEDTTFKFLFNVFDEVASLFPGKFIHIGGDEAIKDQWRASSRINNQMKELGIEDYEELQSYFINKIADHLAKKGKQIIGWDEIIEGNIRSDAIVMHWRAWVDENIALKAAKRGHQVILTPTSRYYFDYYQSEDMENEPLAIGGYIPLDSVYLCDPVPEDFDTVYMDKILGGQANVWTEYMPTPEQVEYMVFPRILALSEVLWTAKDKRDFSDFLSRLREFELYFKEFNINYAKHY
ncbi:MAG: beta-N-acetylhexosaminidase [Bacteroidales bacterium]|nr:MAG: beta-N-acetylhexosaminidase [Bacteroidales bacterium]